METPQPLTPFFEAPILPNVITTQQLAEASQAAAFADLSWQVETAVAIASHKRGFRHTQPLSIGLPEYRSAAIDGQSRGHLSDQGVNILDQTVAQWLSTMRAQLVDCEQLDHVVGRFTYELPQYSHAGENHRLTVYNYYDHDIADRHGFDPIALVYSVTKYPMRGA